MLNPIQDNFEHVVIEGMGLRILAASQKLCLRGIAAKVVAHPRDLDVSGATGMEAVDEVYQVATLIGARGWV